MGPQLEQLASDEAVGIDGLSNARRRRILNILHEVDAPLALADLARELLRREQERPVAKTDHGELRRCYIMLYHNHVPKLADAGVVTFDSDRRTVTLGE